VPNYFSREIQFSSNVIKKEFFPSNLPISAVHILYRFGLFDISVTTSKMVNEVGGREIGFISEPSRAFSFQGSHGRMRDNWRAIFKLFGFAIARMLIPSSFCSIRTMQPL
jgi:hypothetical protein